MPRRQTNDAAAFGHHAPKGFFAQILKRTRAASNSWSGKSRAHFLRSVGMRALRGMPADVERFGARMRLYPAENLCEKRLLFTPQYFDPAELAHLSAIITPDFIFVDIGANIGGYSLFVAARAGPRAKILAIEPQPEIHERLVFNIRQNAFGSIKTLDCAVADREGDVTLFVNARNRGETSMRLVPANGGERLVVRARSLAAIVAAEGFSAIDAMKIDCEGVEDLILEPYFLSVPRSLWPKTLVFEYKPHRWSFDLVTMLLKIGYHERLRTKQNLIFDLATRDAHS